jgi:aryl-alcohol dehydrogenase-like predicted oxidoreductase
MQREGKIRHISISETSVEEYQRCKRSATIVSVQNLYNVDDRSAEDVLKAYEHDDVAFLPWFPLGGKGSAKHAALERIAAGKHDSRGRRASQHRATDARRVGNTSMLWAHAANAYAS